MNLYLSRQSEKDTGRKITHLTKKPLIWLNLKTKLIENGYMTFIVYTEFGSNFRKEYNKAEIIPLGLGRAMN